MILAASSPFFRKLLGRNKHPRPLIYMRGMKSDDLVAIVDFLYQGEANVFQENLDSFLEIAKELQLKGLMGTADEKVDVADGKTLPATPEPVISPLSKKPKPDFSGQRSSYQTDRAEESMALAIPTYFSGDLEELEERVKSMMGKSQNNLPSGRQKADVCKVCGKEDKSNNIKDHIEANHIEGIVIPCNLCNKTFRSRNALRRHKCIDV